MQQPVERLSSTPPSPSSDGAYAGLPVAGAPTASERRNPLAIVGAAASVVPILGMILSILGLVRSQARGGAGRTVAVVGLVASVAFTGGEAYAVYVFTRPAPVDPACVATRMDVDAAQARMSLDVTTLSRAAVAGDVSATSAREAALVADLGEVESTLQRNVGLATHANVRDGIRAFDADLSALISAVRLVEGGDQAALDRVQAVVGKLRTDGRSVDVLCGGRET